MRIKTQVTVSSIAFAVVLLVAAGILVYSNRKSQAIDVQERLVEGLQQSANEMGFLSNAYLLFQERSELDLLQSKLDAIAGILPHLDEGSPARQNLARDIGSNQQRLLAVFADLRSDMEGNPARTNDLVYVRGAWSRMQVPSQAIVSAAGQLSYLIHQESEQQRATNNMVILTLLVGFGALILVNAILMGRRIVSSLHQLQVGAHIIGSGNLDHAIGETGRDEFRDLSHAFNVMTKSLKSVTASKAQLEAANRGLAEAGSQLRQYAYVASHDLKEPLRMVTSFSQMLEKHYKDRLGPDAEQYIDFIVSNAARMQRLLDDLLAYSKAGLHDRPPERTNMAAVFYDVVAKLQETVKQTGATITHDPLPTVQADGILIGKALQHLIENALKFRSKEPPRVHVSARKDSTMNEWVFSVADNGIGIEPELFPRLFTLFQQLQPRGKYPGTGTGLAIVKKIIESQGGRVWVESEPEKGSTFYFSIPLIPGEQEDGK